MKKIQFTPLTAHSRTVLALLLVLTVALAGCQAIRFVLQGLSPVGKERWIPPECEALTEGNKVLVLVFADHSIRYQYELANYDTAVAVAQRIQSQLKGVEVVDPSTVEHFQRANINWINSPLSKIGQQHDADFVLYIELLKFTTDAEASGELLQGRIEANVSLYDASTTSRQLWRGDIRELYPPGSPQAAGLGVSEHIRVETLRLFAENLVNRFHGHYEKI